MRLGMISVAGATGNVIQSTGAIGQVTRTGAGVYELVPTLPPRFDQVRDILEVGVIETLAGNIAVERVSDVLARVRTFTGQGVANDRDFAVGWMRIDEGDSPDDEIAKQLSGIRVVGATGNVTSRGYLFDAVVRTGPGVYTVNVRAQLANFGVQDIIQGFVEGAASGQICVNRTSATQLTVETFNGLNPSVAADRDFALTWTRRDAV